MKKKILHVIESLEFGGAEMVVINLANKLADKYDVSICMTKRQGDLCARVSDKVKLYYLGCGEGNDLSAITKIRNLIRENNIDVVHAHNWSVFLEAVIAAKLAGVSRIIHTIHGPYMAHGKGLKTAIKKKLRRILENILSIFVYRFVPVSFSIRDYLIRDLRINKRKIYPVHNGIAGLDRTLKSEHASDVLSLVTVGRIAKIKNHRMMLEGLRLALDAGTRVQLTIVGDGPEYTAIREYAHSLKLDDHVEFLGFRSDIATIMTNKDVYILTSDYEGISIALLEAMSMGLPAIATSVGGVPETVLPEKTGLLIEKGNARALADAIVFMASHRNTVSTMGNHAYEFFIQEFEENNFIRKYDEIYAS
jgi:glycosyltransferase involved in cell wall biosynthesis